MQLTAKQLKNLPVFTKSNDCLGKIKEVEINSDTQNVSKYIVKSSQMTKRLVGGELIINPSQVVSIDRQKMVVEDNVVRNESLIKEPVAI